MTFDYFGQGALLIADSIVITKLEVVMSNMSCRDYKTILEMRNTFPDFRCLGAGAAGCAAIKMNNIYILRHGDITDQQTIDVQ